MDWAEFEQALHEGIVRAVTAAGDDRYQAAVLDRIYREQDGRIALPQFGLRTDAQDDAATYRDDWLPPDQIGQWEKALTETACSGTTRRWQRTFERYLTVLVRACRKARATLRAKGIIGRDFVVLLLDDEYHESLIKRVLSAVQVREHFPELDERSAALASIAVRPPADRAAHLTGLLGTFDGPVTSEDAESALRDLGPAAFPALTDLLNAPDRAWQAAKLLAEIGQPDGDVINALRVALARTDGPDQRWIAAALSRLGWLDLVLDQADDLPPDVVANAVAAPYTSFRDYTLNPPPLDYRPLAHVIEQRPAYVPALAPGSGYCEITTDEVETAIEALASAHVIIRQHAVGVLGRRGIGKRVLPALVRVMRHDPEAAVRRLAIISLLHWRRDSRHLADEIQEASADPAPEVREAAAYWLREQGL